MFAPVVGTRSDIMLNIQEMLLTNHNRPKKKLQKLKGVAIHYTANYSKGANAIANRNYFNTTNRAASSHYIVDDKAMIRCVPDDEVAYHVGANKYTSIGEIVREKPYSPNFFLIGIEMCVNSDGDFNKMYRNTVDLVVNLLKKYNLTVDNLYRHYDITEKQCPLFMLESKEWNKFKEEVKKALGLVEKTVLRKGSKGQAVKRLQEKLLNLGYDLGKWGADGDFGVATETAVRLLQKKHGLKEDGICGKQTYALIDKLLEEKTEGTKEQYPVLKLSSKGEYVKILQAKLNEFGYNLKVDGDYGLKTKNAVLGYQMKNNIKPYDGICGKLTWNSLLKNGHKIEKPTIEIPIYKIVSLTHALEVEPLRLYNDVCKKEGNLIQGDFANGTFFGYYNGKFVSIGTLVNDGIILAEQLPHDNVKRGTFIVFKNGIVAVEMIDFISKYPRLKDIKFAISGFNMFPLNLKAEWFNPKEVGYETWRTVLGYNPTIKKAIIAVRPSSTAERGRDTLKNLGCIIGIGLDSGGSTNARFNGKTIRTTARRLHNNIRWN